MSVASETDRDVETISAVPAVRTILEVVCRTTGMRFAAVAKVTEERWIACDLRDEMNFDLRPGNELPIDTTICRQVRATGEGVVIDDVAEDARFRDHAAPVLYGFRSYVSVPIRRPDGAFFGTLCAMDPKPRRVNEPGTLGMLRLFADLVGFHLDAQERLMTSESALLGERQTAELREQFIAILGHDLRNPLASIDAGIKRMQMHPLDERQARTLTLMEGSVSRMIGLVANLMDFASARLGGGLRLDIATQDMEPVLDQIVAELEAGWPGRDIAFEKALHHPVACDAPRIGLLLSNLLANALAHGSAEAPVRLRAESDARGFTLSVANAGEPIPPPILDRLFQPFVRAEIRSSHSGLGLGLYVASEIAEAHGGTLEFASANRETRVTFRLPAAAGT